MVLKGTLKSGRWSGKAYCIDLGLDVAYVQVLPVEAAYSDYRTLPDTDTHKDRYAIIDFDRSDRVVGFTVEGLVEDFRNRSLFSRILVDFGLVGVHSLSHQALNDILDYLRDQLPSVDDKGKLMPAFA